MNENSVEPDNKCCYLNIEKPKTEGLRGEYVRKRLGFLMYTYEDMKSGRVVFFETQIPTTDFQPDTCWK